MLDEQCQATCVYRGLMTRPLTSARCMSSTRHDDSVNILNLRLTLIALVHLSDARPTSSLAHIRFHGTHTVIMPLAAGAMHTRISSVLRRFHIQRKSVLIGLLFHFVSPILITVSIHLETLLLTYLLAY